MLLNGAGTHRGGDNRSSHQHLFQDEDCATFSIIKMKSRISNSLLTSPKPMATKISVALEGDLRGLGSSRNQNSSLQKQSASGSTSKYFRQHRPSVLRKGNQPFPQACSGHDWVVDTVCKTEPDSDPLDAIPLYTGQSESRIHAYASSPQPGSPEHTGKHPYSLSGDYLCVKGQCRWPGCSKSEDVFTEYGHFLRHLSTDHAPGDRSIGQLRMQKDRVQHMENQLTAERQKLQAMQLHLLDVKSTSEGGNIVEKPAHLPGLLQPASSNDLYDHERAATDALTQGYWQIATSQVIPGIIPSFEYYKFTNMRPPFTYASMIRWAILKSPEKQLTLKEIYQWFISMFFYFRHNTATWKNAVRHNLSLHKCFVRVEGRKGSVWTVDEEEFLRRKGQKLHRDHDMDWIAPFQLFPLTPQGETCQM
ncbi:forkhead box protein P3a isoform X1 [Danio aesculapii]|uniref:forkhead box protein P3a isoform X1 n=1 Tax=Danio aesculapii TaxID=1142201 RepID=UPI0024C00A2C|nr:forkhead box protein P3a isoform X1 [Danio aesculapii]XP_056319542.1 forkhead box protein P3a isoform X1 [Danio aesculapii]XP_056319543.1 forkhead box protein P3a isoform X1 [Danio aesculapii]XP_056319544.1 forkhead box protein P3a isoform X1 [Danio aesculapii]